MTKIFFILILLNISTALLQSQSGGPPMITDDPGTPDKGAWEINFSFNTLFETVEKEFETPLLDINYGFNERTQLKLESPYLFTNSIPNEYQRRIGNVTLGIKYRFFEEDKSGFALSIYPQISIATETNEKNEYLIPVQIEKKIGKVIFCMDVRYAYLVDDDDFFQNGFLLGYNVSERWKMMSEFIYWVNTYKLSQANGVLNIGMKYQINNVFSFITSTGTGLFSQDNNSRITFISFVGLQINI